MKIFNKLSAEFKKLLESLPEAEQQKENQPKKKRTTTSSKKNKAFYQTILAFQKRLDANFAIGEIEKYFSDRFPLATNDPYYFFHLEVHHLIFIELESRDYHNSIQSVPTIQKYLAADRKVQKDFFMALFYRAIWYALDANSKYGLYEIANLFSRKKLPFTENELIFILKAFIHPKTNKLYSFRMGDFFKNVESHVKTKGMSDPLKETLKQVIEIKTDNQYHEQGFSKIKIRARELWTAHFSDGEIVLPFLLDKKDSFGEKVNSDIKKLDFEIQRKWYKVFQLSATASAGKPSKKFLSKATTLINNLGEKEFIEKMDEWILFLNQMEMTKKSDWYSYFLNAQNIIVAKGFMWFLSTLETTKIDVGLEKLAIKCFKKLPGVGQASGALGNACIYNMSSRNSLAGVAMLNRVRSRVAQRNTKGLIGKYISSTAEELKISVADLEDFSIQDFGLTAGVREFHFNDYIAKLTLVSFGKTKTEWIKPCLLYTSPSPRDRG